MNVQQLRYLVAVSDLGSVLADQFPRQPGDKNELPDAIIEEE